MEHILAEPLQFLTQSHDFANNNQPRRPELPPISQSSNCLDRSHHAVLRRSSAGVNQRHRPLRLASTLHKSIHDLSQIVQAHKYNQRIYAMRELAHLTWPLPEDALWPVTMATLDAQERWVTGIPA